jgi:hypothetical protein
VRKRWGNLFEQLQAKSPEKAKALEALRSPSKPPRPASVAQETPQKDKPSPKKVSENRDVRQSERSKSHNGLRDDPRRIDPPYERYFLNAFDVARQGGQKRGVVNAAERCLKRLADRRFQPDTLTTSQRQTEETRLFNAISGMKQRLGVGLRKRSPDTTRPRAPTHSSATPQRPDLEVDARAGHENSKPGAAQPSTSTGSATQFETNEPRRDEVCDVVLGVDFGTAATKVVLYTPYQFDRGFVVPFGPFGHDTNECLLPTEIVESASGAYALPRNNAHTRHSNLKLEFIEALRSPESDATLKAIERAVAYLALVLQRTRSWFMEGKKGAYGNFHLNWQMHLGAPVAERKKDDLITSYRRLGVAAWIVSTSPNEPSPSIIRDAWHEAGRRLDISSTELDGHAGDLAEIDVIPEVIAEVVSYAESDFRDEGLHLLIDVGAGTFDVCGFILFENKSKRQDRYSLLTSRVELLGAAMLDRKRREAIYAATKRYFAAGRENFDPVAPIPVEPESYVPNVDELLSSVLQANERLKDDCVDTARAVVAALRKARDPNASAWNRELPVFLCGGGSHLELYQSIVEELSDWLENKVPECDGARRLPLQKPDKLDADIPDAEFHRFAVAWGLAQPAIELGDYLTPSEIPDISRHLPVESDEQPWWKREGRFVGPEQV